MGTMSESNLKKKIIIIILKIYLFIKLSLAIRLSKKNKKRRIKSTFYQPYLH